MKKLKLKNTVICSIVLYTIMLFLFIPAVLALSTESFLGFLVSGLLIACEIFLLVKGFFVFFSAGVLLETIHHWKKDRLFFTSDVNGEGEQIFDNLMKRINLYGVPYEFSNTKRLPITIRYRRTSSAEIFYSSIEKNIIVYKTDFLDKKEAADIFSCAKSIDIRMQDLSRPYFFLTKKEKNAPPCRVFLVLIFTNKITNDAIDFIRQDRARIIPCAIDLSCSKYYYNGMKEIRFEDLEGKPSKNIAIYLINHLVFKGSPDLRGNNNFVPGVITDDVLEKPFFEFLKETIYEDIKDNVISKKLCKNLNDFDVLEKDGLLYLKKGGKVTTFFILEDENDSQKINLAIDDLWEYPKKNKISKKDLVVLKEMGIEYFRKQNKQVDFIDMKEQG